ncbi:MAG: type II toxin-antitoxin system Phd/YefM family antitoxin [bacterium]|nr:type II toxin-antitoxin system Phd/YefM family antitoxin [bacterium]
MKTLSISETRKRIKNLVDATKLSGESFVIGRHGRPEVIMIRYPDHFNPALSDITNINAYSTSFDFLKKEPELYSVNDIKKHYA